MAERCDSERALAFGCRGEQLLGVLSLPAPSAAGGAAATAPAATAVLIVVGGPQYRAGSHRQFVLLARHLARSGHATLRFDVRGMGDSEGAARDFLQVHDDIDAAIGALLAAAPGCTRVVLWGLCDAAAAALLYVERAPADARVAGLCLLNPWVRSAAGLARAQVKHYYLRRLGERGFWLKLLRGGVGAAALSDLAGNLRRGFGGGSGGARDVAAADRPFQTRMADGWRGFGGAILLLLSGDDTTAREFSEYSAADPAWQRALAARGRGSVSTVALPGADHTCSDAVARAAAEAATVEWLATLAPTVAT